MDLLASKIQNIILYAKGSSKVEEVIVDSEESDLDLDTDPSESRESIVPEVREPFSPLSRVVDLICLSRSSWFYQETQPKIQSLSWRKRRRSQPKIQVKTAYRILSRVTQEQSVKDSVGFVEIINLFAAETVVVSRTMGEIWTVFFIGRL